ncbi:MAG: hypothetical protein F2923_06095 [Actinobacteria bacterium]|uniref:Unannotated protein n=1 Tax=freshwater metagenome TaxID=449393 RepID=A0A6J7SI16_9ZZZZ|nr:hypothetical protein [Actinomycetota bacterium]
MTSPIRQAPWQVGLAIGATFTAATMYLVGTLVELASISDSALETARIPTLDLIDNGSEHTLIDVFVFDERAAHVFGLVGVALLLLGIFLWVGAYRPGVRLILTITTGVSFVGSFIPLALASNPADGMSESAIAEALVIQGIAFVAALLLWIGAGRRWVALDTTSTWEQN